MTMLPLTDDERATYEWQMWSNGVGEVGQRKLKNATVLVSRAGGLGGVCCYELAAAGIGRLIVAHGGNVKPSDLNRQLLMTHDWLGKPRIESIKRRLKELNPRLEVVGIPENIAPSNVEQLVQQADIVVDAAPLFEERFALNDSSIKYGVPMVEAAMYDFEGYVMSINPKKSACLRCITPEAPPKWKRQFPVFGAVSGSVACIAAVEVIKMITGVGQPLFNRLMHLDLKSGRPRVINLVRDQNCSVCSERNVG